MKNIFLFLLANISLITIISSSISLYGQCGGVGYVGSTDCVANTTCYENNLYYSQCLTSCPGSNWLCYNQSKIFRKISFD
jgi:hypothetical protein